MRGYVGTDHRHQNFKLFLGWFSGFREKLVKKCCLPKCVLTPKDHFERYFSVAKATLELALKMRIC